MTADEEAAEARDWPATCQEPAKRGIDIRARTPALQYRPKGRNSTSPAFAERVLAHTLAPLAHQLHRTGHQRSGEEKPEFQRTSTPVTGNGYDRPEGITPQSRYTLFRPSDCPNNPDHLKLRLPDHRLSSSTCTRPSPGSWACPPNARAPPPTAPSRPRPPGGCARPSNCPCSSSTTRSTCAMMCSKIYGCCATTRWIPRTACACCWSGSSSRAAACLAMAVHESLTRRLRLAGCEHPLFEPPAVEALFHSARGLPRLINRIAHYALTAAAVKGACTVTAEHLEHAIEEWRR